MSNSSPIFTILSEDDTFKNSLKKMLQKEEGLSSDININCNKSIRKAELVILDLHSRDKVEKYAQDLTTETNTIPFTIVLGIEQSLDDYDRLFLSELYDPLKPIRLLTHACGKKYCRYFSLLDEKSRLIIFIKKKIKDDGKSLKLENPFKEISKVEELKNVYSSTSSNNKSTLSNNKFIKEAGEYCIPEHRKRRRHEGFHEKEGIDTSLAFQFYDLAIACVKRKSQEWKEEKKFNVLLIENSSDGKIEGFAPLNLDNAKKNESSKLESCLKKIEELFDHDYKFWIYPKEADYQTLKDKLDSILDNSADRQKCETEILDNVKPIDELNKQNNGLSFKDIDLILIDIYLEKGAKLSGLDFLKLFTLLYPEIPAFILSVSEDTEVIGKAIKQKADYFILKKNIFSLPLLFYEYIDGLGRLISYINNRDLKRNLIGNIRYWRFKKDFLWFGDKCYHMINHSFNHVENDWRIAHQVLIPILDYFGKDYFLDEGLYCFFMGIWLHDIGHKGNERYGEPHEIRDLHGLISAELILKHPEHYGIYGYNKPDSSPYRWLSFRHPRTASQIIRERIASLEAAGRVLKQADKKTNVEQPIQKLTILEKIALLCIYHKSNFPMDEKYLENIVRAGKRIPRDCYENFDRSTSPIHLKSFSDLMGDQNLLQLMALFRFIDGLDINGNRVGDETEEGVKKETIKRDLSYQLFKLKNDVSQLANTHLRNTEKERRFISLFYDQVEQNIQEQQWISEDLKKEQRRFLDTLQRDVPLDNYYMLTEYIEFISVQEGHFGLHNSIEKLEIVVLPPHDDSKTTPRFQIKYISRKKADILNNKDKVTVKERGQKEGRTIRDHLLGEPEEKDGKKTDFRKNDGYVRRELNSVKEYLKDWFDLKNTKIYLHGSDKLYEERPQKSEILESD